MGLIFFTIILFHSVYSTSGSTCTVPLTWDERYEPFIRCAGFLPLAQLVTTRGLPLMHSTTLTSLVDRWHPEIHMFHLSCGETTMMLQDITMILGLLIDGTPVCGMVSSAGWRDSVGEAIGIRPPTSPRIRRTRRRRVCTPGGS
jgi:hypothetical protein